MQHCPPAVSWAGDAVEIVDQRLLPDELRVRRLGTTAEVIEAISTLAVRGAPAIGICAAFGVVLALDELRRDGATGLDADVLGAICRRIQGARPTAVNLSWAVGRVHAAAITTSRLDEARERAASQAQAILDQDRASCERIGRLGAAALEEAHSLMTHCNTGRLVSAGRGTALGVVYAKAEAGHPVRVLACEARPLLQGARLTMWELVRAGIPATLIVDGAAGIAMQRRLVDAVIVGADRIAANGDTANKIGTLNLAVLAEKFGVPFYVAAPLSSFDLACPAGESIAIEERDGEEVRGFRGRASAPDGVQTWNPAFDVTPGALVRGFITEVGVLVPPFDHRVASGGSPWLR